MVLRGLQTFARGAVASLLIAAVSAIAAGQVCFQPPFPIALGEPPGPGLTELIAADFNRDGVLDLAGTLSSNNSVVLLLGTATGSFGAASFFPVGAFPASLAAADLDGDGTLDVAVANNNASDISILLGNGTGGFTTAPSVDVSSFPSAIAAGDFNSDGRIDLVVDALDGIEVLLANGTSGFEAPVLYPAGIRLFPHSIVTDDIDADRDLDIVVANPDDIGSVLIFQGDGTGRFGSPLVIPTGVSAWSVAIGDFNLDTHRDLAVANRGTTSPLGSSDIAVLLGTTPGSFFGPTSFLAGQGARDVAVGDIDRDGEPDLAVANQFCCGSDLSAAALSVLPGDGIGGFGTPLNFAVGPTGFFPGPIAIVLGDFNRDQRLDVALGDSGIPIWIFLACGPPAEVPTLRTLGFIVLAAVLALIGASRLSR